MSLARLALRLAAYEAINPFATVAAGPWPTIAGGLVYDSRIDPIQGSESLDAIEGKPLLIIYTEEDHSTPYGTAKYPPDEQVVHLVVEAVIAAKGTVVVDNGDGPPTTYGTLTAPITNRQHESLLDLLEAQVRRVIDTRNRIPTSAILDKVLMEIHRVESVPQRDDDRITRMAARTITFVCKVKKEAWPKVPAAAALPTPLADVAALLAPSSTGGILCASLVSRMQSAQPAALVPLDRIAISTDQPGDDPMNEPISSSVQTNP